MSTPHLGYLGGAAILAASTSALAGMNGISYDYVDFDLVPDACTVRVYAELDAGNRLDAVFGNSVYNMRIDMIDGAVAYQNDLGGPTSQSINSAFFPLAPSLEWDSYVTIGSLYSDGTPFANNALQDIGIDWAPWDPAGGNLFADNGTWFVTPADPQGDAQNGRVLIAQFTTFGGASLEMISFTAGFQGKDAAGNTWQSGHDVTIYCIPAPGMVALIGIAGLSAKRRRRN
jgi:hypothetical protein